MNYLPNIILANLFLILIWISYELFLSRIRNFQANRFFLLGGSVLAVILPWLPWQISIRTQAGSILGLPLVQVSEPVIDPSLAVGSGGAAPLPDPVNWIGIAYLSIVLALILVSAGQLIRLFIWTKTRPVLNWNEHRVVVLNKPWSAFSFFRTIFYPEPFEPDTKETQIILEHEFVSFVVNRKGETTNIQIVKGVDPVLDEAVMNVIRSSPAWKPGLQRGKPVNVSFSIPIKFVLN